MRQMKGKQRSIIYKIDVDQNSIQDRSQSRQKRENSSRESYSRRQMQRLDSLIQLKNSQQSSRDSFYSSDMSGSFYNDSGPKQLTVTKKTNFSKIRPRNGALPTLNKLSNDSFLPIRKRLGNAGKYFPIITSGNLFDHRVYFAQDGINPLSVIQSRAHSPAETKRLNNKSMTKIENRFSIEKTMREFDNERHKIIKSYQDQLHRRLKSLISQINSGFKETIIHSKDSGLTPSQILKPGHRRWKSTFDPGSEIKIY